MDDTSQNPNQTQPHSPAVNVSDPQPKQDHKIVMSPKKSEFQQQHFITQDDVDIEQTQDQPADNTRAKQMKRTIMQEFAKQPT